MNLDEFISVLKNPDAVKVEQLADLGQIVEQYPYFAPARLFYAKAMQKSENVLFGANLKFSSVYCSNRRWLYYYIYPDRKVSSEPYKKERQKSSGDYFDMMSAVESEGGDTKKSLLNLASRLKSARALVSQPAKTAPVITSADMQEANPVSKVVVERAVLDMLIDPINTSTLPQPKQASEEDAKKCIRERKYVEAIEILKELNLNNPKKSVYFADQIRFLEKVIANSKK